MSLIEVLAKAGSTTENASSQVLIVRPRDGRAVDGPTLPGPDSDVIEIDITALEAGRFDQNAALRHNDTVMVPRAERVFVYGQVKSPGSYPLKKGTTVLQALALAGGVTDRGSDSRIRIRRQEAGRLTEMKVKLDDPVQAGDSIVVLERFW
jgi:polysaccharide export outer membrane protein